MRTAVGGAMTSAREHALLRLPPEIGMFGGEDRSSGATPLQGEMIRRPLDIFWASVGRRHHVLSTPVDAVIASSGHQ